MSGAQEPDNGGQQAMDLEPQTNGDQPAGDQTEEEEYHKYQPREDLEDFLDYSVCHTIPVSEYSCPSVKFRKDGAAIATAAGIPEAVIKEHDPVKIWDVETGKETSSFKGHKQGVSDVSWSHDMNLLASVSDDKTVRIWDIRSGQCAHTLKGHTHDVTSCAFNFTGNMLASASMDETIRIWDVQNGRCIRIIPGHSDPVTYVDFFGIDDEHPLLVSASLDGISRIWSPLTGACLRSLLNTANMPLSFAQFTPNAKYVLLGMIGGRLELWDYVERSRKKVYKGHVNKYFCVRGSFLMNDPRQQSGYIVCGSEDHHVYVWDLNHPNRDGGIQLLRGRESMSAAGDGHYSAVLAVDCNPATAMIASASAAPDGSVKLWKPSS